MHEGRWGRKEGWMCEKKERGEPQIGAVWEWRDAFCLFVWLVGWFDGMVGWMDGWCRREQSESVLALVRVFLRECISSEGQKEEGRKEEPAENKFLVWRVL